MTPPAGPMRSPPAVDWAARWISIRACRGRSRRSGARFEASMPRRSSAFVPTNSRISRSGEIDAAGHVPLQKNRALFAVTQVHLEVLPAAVAQHAHPPGASHRIVELPEDVIAILVA